MEVQNFKDSNNEEQNKMESFDDKIIELETENKKIRDEFNVQRAKMKDLFLQKEEEINKEKNRLNNEIEKLQEELNDVRSQLLIAGMKFETDLEDEKRKAQEEIATLQQLVQETLEESSSSRTMYDTEIRKLQQTIQQLQEENRDLRSLGQQQSSPHHSAQESSSLVSAMTKSLVRKLGADTFSGQENLEESMRRAQEDAEMLRSLVLPLEEEIRALKDKLRATDEQLQRCQLCRHQDATVEQPQTEAEGTEEEAKCDMCCNYEAQLVREQQQAQQLQSRLAAAEKSAERQQEELRKEIGFRKDMEAKWNEKTEEHRTLVASLSERTSSAEQQLKQLKIAFNDHSSALGEQLASLTQEHESIHERLGTLQRENERLVGQYSRHSRELQNEVINLPDTVEELHERVLRLQEELIIAFMAKEAIQEQLNKLQSEMVILQTQQSDTDRLYQQVLSELEVIKKENEKLESDKRQLIETDVRFKENERKLTEARQQIRQLEAGNAELRQHLVNSEHVQKDFVLLSQSLQVQLEKIRASDTAVRWQHEDDVSDCPSCKTSFANTRRSKQHCRHCGQIFCSTCLLRTVPSGPHQRPTPVCDVCHTLLVKSSAPYFSTDPPHSPN